MLDPSDFYTDIEHNIARSGQHLFLIFADGATPAFAYSIGNALQGLPELLLIGNFSPRVAGSILNELGRKMREARSRLKATSTSAVSFPFACAMPPPKPAIASRSRPAAIFATKNMTSCRCCCAIPPGSIPVKRVANLPSTCRWPDAATEYPQPIGR
jgi:hypothetical protein